MNKDNIIALEKLFEYSFNDKKLAEESITHPSFYSCSEKPNNERLEFLGDAVLNLAIAEILYSSLNNLQEDSLSKLRAKLVSCDAICYIANRTSFKQIILMSFGEERNGGRDNPNNVENAFEAVIGAIYLDGGFLAAKKVISFFWNDLINNQDVLGVDYKTALQEWAQKNKHEIPLYIEVDRSGPSHAPTFKMMVEINNVGKAFGEGSNKKEAEKNAAADFITNYLKNEDL
jgi:ribonuclease III